MDIKDITIIGGGPTGIFALFYAGMRRATAQVVDALPELGGQLTAQRSLAQLPQVTSASGIRSGQAEIDGSVEQVIAANPAEIDSLFDLRPKEGQIRA